MTRSGAMPPIYHTYITRHVWGHIVNVSLHSMTMLKYVSWITTVNAAGISA